MFDRIETTYNAIDDMADCDGKPRPERFGGGKWNKDEELAVYAKQVGKRYSPIQWRIIMSYAKDVKKFDTAKAERIIKRLK